ncbi:Heme/hemopexin utilization protein C [Thauera sp. GDN1]|uniref:TonB-dependent receptor plug domain-containing protein n=1 Tax=Thauera sp. GDN1 TaxID=2944810 RepID=UPI002479CE80|nr:TonB-dependent receptor [Thauera sp. GDN1]WEN41641.1 Heme/hemopexin utilization protein C [Thauera sp. GDN1]
MHNTFRRLPLAVAISLALPAFALAQETTLGRIVVTGSATAANPTEVAPGTVQALRPATSDTASLLRDVPGVSTYGAGGMSSLPVIRGLADDRIRVKVDGMDLIATCPNHMNPALSYLDPANVGLLEVYPGVSPVSVGGDSIAGTIVAESKAPVFAEPGQGIVKTGEISGFYRSNGDAVGGSLAATLANEAFSVSYVGSIAESDNYDAAKDFKSSRETGRIGHELPLDEVGSSAYKSRNHDLGFAFKGGNHLIEAKIGLQDLPYQLYPNQRMDMLDNEQLRLNLRYTGAFDWGALEMRAYREKVDHFMDFGADKRYWYAPMTSTVPVGTPCASPGATTCAAGMPMYSESRNTGFALKADVSLSETDLLRLGAELQRYTLDDWWPASGLAMWPGTFWNVSDGERNRAGIFAEWEKQVSPQWTTLAGIRYERVTTDAGDVRGYDDSKVTEDKKAHMDARQYSEARAFNQLDHKRTDDNVDLSLLARYTHDANLDVEFGLARKVRSPNLYERYTWSSWSMAALMNNFVGDGNGYVGNVGLKPEKAHTISATFDWHAADRNWEFKATPYLTYVSDYIDAIAAPSRTYTPGTFNVLQFENQSARLYGIELSGRMPLASTEFGEFGLRGQINYTRGKNRDTGDDLYNIMPLNAKLALTQQLGGWDNAIELEGVKAKSKVSDVRNEIETPGYALTHLRTSYSWKSVRVDFGVENLFDKFYYLPLGGVYLGQGTTMRLPANGGAPYGVAVPGAGRSIYAGINYKF